MQVLLHQALPSNVNRNLRFSNWSADSLSAPVTQILNLPIPQERIRARHDRPTFGVPPLGGSRHLFPHQSSASSLTHAIEDDGSRFGVPPLGGSPHPSPYQSINPTIHQSTATRPSSRLIDFALPRLHVATRVVTDS